MNWTSYGKRQKEGERPKERLRLRLGSNPDDIIHRNRSRDARREELRTRESHFSQAAQKCPDARPPRRFSPAGQAGNPESGVATNKERLLPRRRVGESARGVLGCTPQQACPVLDTGKDEGNAADGRFSAAC